MNIILKSKVYINHPDSDKGNLTIAYITLDRKFPDTAFVAVFLRSNQIFIYRLQTYLLMCEHLGRCIKLF